MKRILLFIIISSAVMLSACKKDERDCCVLPGLPSLSGVWMLMETQVSPGSIGGWMPYDGPLKFVIFHKDGRLTTAPGIMGFSDGSYLVQSATELLMVNSFNNDSVVNFYQLHDNKLTVSYRGIEPNGVRFKRISK